MSMNRRKMPMHTKKYIDSLFSDLLYNTPCHVPLIKLAVEDIQNSKLNFLKYDTTKKEKTSKNDIKFKGIAKPKAHKTSKNDTLFKGNRNSKADIKYQKNNTSAEEPPYKKLKLSTDKIDEVKLVLSKDDETDTPIKKGKTLKNSKTSKEVTKFKGNRNSKVDIKSIDNKTSKADQTSKDNTKFKGNRKSKVSIKSQDNKKSKDNKTSKDNTKLKVNRNSKVDKKFQDKKKSKDNKTSKADQTSKDNTKFKGNRNPKINIKSQDNKKSKDNKTSEAGQTSKDNTKFKGNRNSKVSIKSQDNKKSKDNKISKADKTSKDSTKFKSNKNSKFNIKCQDKEKSKNNKISKADKISKGDTKFKGCKNSEFDIKPQDKITSKADIKNQHNSSSIEEESPIKKLKLCTDKIDDIKLVLSIEGKTDTPEKEGKKLNKYNTSKENLKLMGNTNSNADTKFEDKRISAAEESPKKKLKLCKDKLDVFRLVLSREGEPDTSKTDKTSKDDTKVKGNRISKSDVKCQNNAKESSRQKLKLCRDKIDAFNLILSSEGGPIKPKKEGTTLKKDKPSKDDINIKDNTISKIEMKYHDYDTSAEEDSPNKNLNLYDDKIYTVKLELSREGETDSLEKYETSKDETMFKGNTMPNTDTKSKDNLISAVEESPNEKLNLCKDKMDVIKLVLSREAETNPLEKYETSKDETIFKGNTKSQNNSTNLEEEFPFEKLQLCKNKTDVKLVLSKEGETDSLEKDETMFMGNTMPNSDTKSHDDHTSAEDPPNQKMMLCKDKIHVFESVLSVEGENNTLEKDETSIDDTNPKGNTDSSVDMKYRKHVSAAEKSNNEKLKLCDDKIYAVKLELSREGETDSLKKDETFKDETMFKGNTMSNTDTKSQNNNVNIEESPNEKLKLCKDKIDFVKLVSSRESETDPLEKDETMFIGNTMLNTDTKSHDNHTSAEESPNQKLMLCKDKIDTDKLVLSRESETMFKGNTMPNTDTNSVVNQISTEEMSPNKKLKLCNDKMDVVKLVLSRGAETMFKGNTMPNTATRSRNNSTNVEEETPNKKLIFFKDEIDVVKMVLSKETTLEKDKTTKDDIKIIGNRNSNNYIKSQEKNTYLKEKFSKNKTDIEVEKSETYTQKKDKTFKDYTKFRDNKMSNTDIKCKDNDIYAEEESLNKNLKLCKDKMDVIELISSRESKTYAFNKDQTFKANTNYTVDISQGNNTNAENESTSKKRKLCKDKLNVVKLGLPREGEVDKLGKEKTSKDATMFKSNIISKTDIKYQNNNTYAEKTCPNEKLKLCKDKMDVVELGSFRESKTYALKNDQTFKGNTNYTVDISQGNNTNAENESTSKKRKLCIDKLNVVKLVLPREGEVDKLGKEKTSKDATMFKSNIISKTDIKYQKNNTYAEKTCPNEKLKLCKDKMDVVELGSFRESKTYALKNDQTFKGNTNYTVDISQGNNTNAENESTSKKRKLCKDKLNVVKLVLPREGEVDKLGKEKTSKDATMFKSNIISKTDIKYQKNNTYAEKTCPNEKLKLCKDKMDVVELGSFRESKTYALKNDQTFKGNTNYTVDISQGNNTNAENESTSKKRKLCKDKLNVVQLVLPREGEDDKLGKEKTSKDATMFKSNIISKTDIKYQKNNTYAEKTCPNEKLKLCKDKMDVVELGSFRERKTYALKNDQTFKGNTNYTVDISQGNNTNAENESTSKKRKLCKDKLNVVQLVLPREGEVDKLGKEKTSKDATMFKSNIISKTDIKYQKNNTFAEKTCPNEKLKLCKDKMDVVELGSFRESKTYALKKDQTFKGNTNYIVDISQGNDTSSEKNSPNKKLKLYNDKIDVFKLVLSRDGETDPLEKDETMFIGNTTLNTDTKSHYNHTSAEESPNKKLKFCNTKIDVVDLVSFRECETYTLKKDKTFKDYTKFRGNKNSKVNMKPQGKIISKDDTMFEGNIIFNTDIKPQDNTTSKDNQISKVDIKSQAHNTSVEKESPNKKTKSCTDKINVVQLLSSMGSETKSHCKPSIRPITEIASTSTEKGPTFTLTDLEGTTKSIISPEKNVSPRIQVINLARMMSESNLLRWNKMKNFDKLFAIEKLYVKYFSKSIQDTIVTIANILNIISISNKHHETRINESDKKITAAERLKECCDADQLHSRHKKILETKLKSNFINVVSLFAESEFDSAFQMFFLSILTVLRVLNQPSFKLGGVFKKLVSLLWNSLKNSKFEHPKIYSMFRSKSFKPNCVDKITVIEDSRDDDPDVVNRMELFFISTAISRKYFQGVIDAVTSDSNEDLSILIDNATFQCCINSKFKDPIDSSTVQQSNDKIPVTETIRFPANSVETIQNWSIANNPNGTYQQMPVFNVGQTIVNDAVEQPIVTRVEPLIFNNAMMQFTTSSSEAVTSTPTTGLNVAFNPSLLIKKSVPNIHLHNAVGTTIKIENKNYKLIKGPSGELRALADSSDIFVESPSTTNIKCNAKNCKNSVNIMCSRCEIAKYCDTDCQQLDWYDNHVYKCEQLLLNKGQTRT